MDGCIYRTKDGECDLYAEGGKYHAFCVGDAPCDGRKQSNADKIRQMSDEELAFYIFNHPQWVDLDRRMQRQEPPEDPRLVHPNADHRSH